MRAPRRNSALPHQPQEVALCTAEGGQVQDRPVGSSTAQGWTLSVLSCCPQGCSSEHRRPLTPLPTEKHLSKCRSSPMQASLVVHGGLLSGSCRYSSSRMLNSTEFAQTCARPHAYLKLSLDDSPARQDRNAVCTAAIPQCFRNSNQGKSLHLFSKDAIFFSKGYI